MRSTRGSRPDRVCIRVSKQTRWMRCRDSTHQARRTTCRRDGGTVSTAAATVARMITAQPRVMALASSHRPATVMSRAVSSVRNRHRDPAAL